MNDRTYNVLILCTGNSARSILGEALVNLLGKGRFRGFSAGSHPTGKVNPGALRLLQAQDIDTAELRSKSWDEFGLPGAPSMDFIFTVCDSAAGEACPVWPGHPVSAHFGVPDPAKLEGSTEEIDQAFRQAWRTLRHRLQLFMQLPLDKLDAASLKSRLGEIGQSHPD